MGVLNTTIFKSTRSKRFADILGSIEERVAYCTNVYIECFGKEKISILVYPDDKSQSPLKWDMAENRLTIGESFIGVSEVFEILDLLHHFSTKEDRPNISRNLKITTDIIVWRISNSTVFKEQENLIKEDIIKVYPSINSFVESKSTGEFNDVVKIFFKSC